MKEPAAASARNGRIAAGGVFLPWMPPSLPAGKRGSQVPDACVCVDEDKQSTQVFSATIDEIERKIQDNQHNMEAMRGVAPDRPVAPKVSRRLLDRGTFAHRKRQRKSGMDDHAAG